MAMLASLRARVMTLPARRRRRLSYGTRVATDVSQVLLIPNDAHRDRDRTRRRAHRERPQDVPGPKVGFFSLAEP